ncbi:hypothetical protein CHCC16736_0434 [Bacillus licheniformis]|uniref:Uncharacterized protein n=1 Tax=Bacillus licheniformis TaxID=1402 RepID=A0A8B5Y6T6_BACLI|nr:hypothetical protein CHCC16736_0434 [Bacillus licheniformis]
MNLFSHGKRPIKKWNIKKSFLHQEAFFILKQTAHTIQAFDLPIPNQGFLLFHPFQFQA